MSRPILPHTEILSSTIKVMMRHEVGRKSDQEVDITLSFPQRRLDPDLDAARELLHPVPEPTPPWATAKT